MIYSDRHAEKIEHKKKSNIRLSVIENLYRIDGKKNSRITHTRHAQTYFQNFTQIN